jgi:hypothetical protein
MKRLAVAVILAASLVVAGCTPTETAAFRTLTGSKAIIESEMTKHGECRNSSASSATPLCDALNKAIPAQHAAVLILDSYCASPDYLTNQGPCRPPTDPNVKADLKAKLTTAINNLNSIIASVKSAAGGAS